MGGRDVEESSFRFGIAEGAEISEVGIRYVHRSQPEDRGDEVVVVPNAAEVCRIFGAGIDLESRARLL